MKKIPFDISTERYFIKYISNFIILNKTLPQAEHRKLPEFLLSAEHINILSRNQPLIFPDKAVVRLNGLNPGCLHFFSIYL